MTRPFATFGMAALCACALSLTADAQSRPKTDIDVDHGKKVTYTGCVENGAATETYVLAEAIPFTSGETRGTTGTDSTTYMLVPEKTVRVHEHVGQRVKVTGVVIKPGHGDAKIETKTKENGSETKTKEEIKRGPMPQFRVVSIEPLGKPCK